MDLLSLNIPEFEKFLFVLFRVAAIILFAPILGSSQIPSPIKVGFILFVSIAVYPSVQEQMPPAPRGLFELVTHLVADVTIGLAIAFVARLVFTAVSVAGAVVDFQMGFGVVSVIDPQTQAQISITAQFQNILTVFIFLSLDAHHVLIWAILESFQQIDPQSIDFSAVTPGYILRMFAMTFVTGAKIAAPIMAILFFTSVGLGLVARTVPQMNVFIVGFPLQIGVGLLMIGLSVSFFHIVIKGELSLLPQKLLGLMQTF